MWSRIVVLACITWHGGPQSLSPCIPADCIVYRYMGTIKGRPALQVSFVMNSTCSSARLPCSVLPLHCHEAGTLHAHRRVSAARRQRRPSATSRTSHSNTTTVCTLAGQGICASLLHKQRSTGSGGRPLANSAVLLLFPHRSTQRLVEAFSAWSAPGLYILNSKVCACPLLLLPSKPLRCVMSSLDARQTTACCLPRLARRDVAGAAYRPHGIHVGAGTWSCTCLLCAAPRHGLPVMSAPHLSSGSGPAHHTRAGWHMQAHYTT